MVPSRPPSDAFHGQFAGPDELDVQRLLDPVQQRRGLRRASRLPSLPSQRLRQVRRREERSEADAIVRMRDRRRENLDAVDDFKRGKEVDGVIRGKKRVYVIRRKKKKRRSRGRRRRK